MNSTAIPNRTESSRFAFRLDATMLRSLAAFAALAIIWISFRPLLTDEEVILIGRSSSGNAINQIGYSLLFLVSAGTLMMFVDRRVPMVLFGPGWLAIFVLVGFSAFTAPETDTAIRAVAYALIVTMTAASVPALAPSASALAGVLTAVAALVLGLSYGGLVFMPEAAVHQAVGAEAAHAGLWRGLFTHKNIAGPVMGAIAFIGLYLLRRGQRLAGAAIMLAAIVFVWNTGSKTSAALVPAIIALVAIPAMAGLRVVTALLVLGAIVTIHALTIGSVFVPLFDDILRAFNATTTYTGRTEIWRFAGDYVVMHPLTGFGYDSFWLNPVVENAEQYFDQEWDLREAVHGHHGFLDLALLGGFPVLALSVWLFVVAPLIDYLRTPPLRENVLLADLWLMIVAFVTMNAALESFFFRRSDPVWLTLVVALFGLRLVARMRIPPR